jgi:hypothetical protein
MIGGPPIAAGSYITATAAAKAESSGRRNGLVGRSEKFVKCLCGRLQGGFKRSSQHQSLLVGYGLHKPVSRGDLPVERCGIR